MKVIARGDNPYLCETLLGDNILSLDGVKIHSVDLFITEIKSRRDVDELITQLNVIKLAFIKE